MHYEMAINLGKFMKNHIEYLGKKHYETVDLIDCKLEKVVKNPNTKLMEDSIKNILN